MHKNTGFILVTLAALLATAVIVYGQEARQRTATPDQLAVSPATAQRAERIAAVLAEKQEALGLTDAQVDRLAEALAASQTRSQGDHGHRGDYCERDRLRHRHGDDWCYRDHRDRWYDYGWCCH